MANYDEPTGNLIDLRHDNQDDAGAQVDASLYKLAAIFGEVAFPTNMPEDLKQAILDAADQARNAEGSILASRQFDSDGQRRDAKRDDDNDNMSVWANIVQQEMQDREREVWAHTQSTVGGVTMTGAQWAEFADRLRKDKKLKEEIIDAFEKRGMTEEEAEAHYERVTDVAEIAAKPPSQRTEEETERFEKANADPAFAQDMKQAQAIMKDSPSPQSSPVSANTLAQGAVASRPSSPSAPGGLDF